MRAFIRVCVYARVCLFVGVLVCLNIIAFVCICVVRTFACVFACLFV